MANDREVLRIIWEGQVPICFQANPDEVSAVRQPEDFYLMVSRLSYLPLVTDKVRHLPVLRHSLGAYPNFVFFVEQVKKHFTKYVSNEDLEGEVWFDFNGTPLKWHYPIGKSAAFVVHVDAIFMFTQINVD